MTTNEIIAHAMARAFFASAWSDMQDEKEAGVNLSGCEIMDVMPEEIDPAALHAAKTLIFGLSRENLFWRAKPGKADFDAFLEQLFSLAETTQEDTGDFGNRELTPELFGHYLAMQAMGTGVGLESFGNAVRDAIAVPFVDFGSHSLQKDY
jgi:hypothetical protein